MGKTRNGEIQNPKEKFTESTIIDKKEEKKEDFIPTVVKVNTQSVNDYFAQKMAAKGLTLAGMLSGIPDQVATPSISRNGDSNSDKESILVEQSTDSHLNSKIISPLAENKESKTLAENKESKKSSKKEKRKHFDAEDIEIIDKLKKKKSKKVKKNNKDH